MKKVNITGEITFHWQGTIEVDDTAGEEDIKEAAIDAIETFGTAIHNNIEIEED